MSYSAKIRSCSSPKLEVLIFAHQRVCICYTVYLRCVLEHRGVLKRNEDEIGKWKICWFHSVKMRNTYILFYKCVHNDQRILNRGGNDIIERQTLDVEVPLWIQREENESKNWELISESADVSRPWYYQYQYICSKTDSLDVLNCVTNWNSLAMKVFIWTVKRVHQNCI